MRALSNSIFEWDASDVKALSLEKAEELKKFGIERPSPDVVKRAIAKEELSRHCRRRIRGAAKTIGLIDELFASMREKTDTLGVRLLRDDYQEL
jgi:hypothetical protein